MHYRRQYHTARGVPIDLATKGPEVTCGALKMNSADDMAVASGLDLKLVDRIAQRVLELLGDRNGDEVQLLTVAQVARRFQVHPSWVLHERSTTRSAASRNRAQGAIALRSTPRGVGGRGPAPVRRPAYRAHASARGRRRWRRGRRSSQTWATSDRECLSASDREQARPRSDADADRSERSRRPGGNATGSGASRCGSGGRANGSGCLSDSKRTGGTTTAQSSSSRMSCARSRLESGARLRRRPST